MVGGMARLLWGGQPHLTAGLCKYQDHGNQSTDDARDELLRLLAAVRTQLENSAVPTVERVTYLAARLRESPRTHRP